MRDSVFTSIMQEKFQCAGVEEKGQKAKSTTPKLDLLGDKVRNVSQMLYFL